MRPLLLPLLLLAACSGGDAPDKAGPKPDRAAAGIVDLEKREPRSEPDYVTVDHILIAVKGPEMPGGLSQDEAAVLVEQILDELAGGGSWVDLKQTHSKDSSRGVVGGPYPMSNKGALRQTGATPRGKMVGAFGDVGFQLKLDEIAVASYKVERGPGHSPFGYHIIKRVK